MIAAISRRPVSKTGAGLRCFTRPARSLHNTQKRPPLAFAFDIDGVLLRGAEVTPTAKRTLDILDGDNPFGAKIPYILLTNGGGVSEQDRCQKLTKQLGREIRPNQLIQAHTILKKFAERYSDSAVLVLGGKRDVIRKVAESYGFKKAYTTLDVHAWNPSVWPFYELSTEERLGTKKVDFPTSPISAVFVFHDPRNWSLDIQIMCDVIQSGGIIGGPYAKPGTSKPVELVFCNPDLLWRSDFERPRLGQGAFKDAFQAVYKALTRSEYPYVQFGKPTTATYQFAEQVLSELSGCEDLPPVYMIGDNPESDIAGANGAGWASVLVHTGVYDPFQGPPSHPPTHEASNVEEAIKWAIKRELKGNY